MDQIGANGYLTLLKKIVELSELRITSKLPAPRGTHPLQIWTVVLWAANQLPWERRKLVTKRVRNNLRIVIVLLQLT